MNMKVADEAQKIKLDQVLGLLMKEANINASQLSRNTGLAVTTIKRLCTGDSNPTVNSLEPVARYFNVTIAQLLGIDPTLLNREKGVTIPNVNSWSLVPLITLEEALDWPASKAAVKARTQLEYIPIDADTDDTLYAIRLQGQVLEPRFKEGTNLVFTQQQKPSDGSIVLIQHKDKSLPQYKEAIFDGSDMYIRSVNPDLPGNKITLFDQSTTKVLGVLCHARMDFVE